ncbi:ABC transporter substrate-binding protein [Natrialba hulunbeirensis]|nr:ABC transporter substrate-binding protein [Natrialba hulunbeirensis]
MANEIDQSRRTFLKTAGAGAAVATFAGCITDEDPSEDDGGDEGMLNRINSTMTSLDPIQSTDTASGEVINQIYEGLTYFPNGGAEVENLLAEEVDISDDLLTYTFTLKEAEYHDGTELTADDFVYAFRRLAESENSERANFILGDIFLAIEHETDDDGAVVPESIGAEAVDDRTFEITLRSANPNALDLLSYDSFSAIPEGIVGDIEGYDGEYEHGEFASEVAVGTGPFEFDSWDPDAEAEVSTFDDYHGSVANIDGVHWQILEDDTAHFTYAMNRSADVFSIPTADYDQSLIDAETDDEGREIGEYGPVENGDMLDYVGVPQLSTYYFAFNAPSVPVEIRQAVAYVLNREDLVQDIFQGRGEEAVTFTPPGAFPGGPERRDEFIEDYPYELFENDRDAARDLIEQAGYDDDDPYELTLTTYESEVFQEAGRYLRDNLAGLGVDLQLEETPFATLQEQGENGNLEFYSLGWTWSWPAADYGMFGFEPENTNTSLMPGDASGYYLDWHEEDSDASAMAQEAWETVEANPEPEEGQEARNEAYIDMEQAIWDDAVMLPLYHEIAEQFNYQHVDIEPFGTMGDYLQRYNNVTLDE